MAFPIDPAPVQSLLQASGHNASLDRLRALAEDSLRAIRARATVHHYLLDWCQFCSWCQEQQLRAFPASPDTVILFATDLTKNGERKVSTIQRKFSAISKIHLHVGVPSPTHAPITRQFLSGLRRELGVAVTRKRPVLVDDLKVIIGALPNTLIGTRNRCILLLGFAGAFRRSELVALNTTDFETTAEGLVVAIRRGQTDQVGEGRVIGIPYGTGITCPVRALQDWLAASGIVSGPVFRQVNRHGQILPGRLSGEAVALVVKQYVEQLGFDPHRFAGHSLRAGLAVSAAAHGKSERSIMKQTGHKISESVRRYINDGQLFRDNAVDGLGL
ncbi:MAG: site-specific integrase [Acidobacteriaceae bacterium]|nr:site-specific integrase [Acidobacteriaceae bacterium]MBV9675852.1 site-specific integrase [Acidobacteriaceae bacterium]